ncbi:hypothetical protein [Paenibacillus apiarius]|uniref:Cardiolipin synthase N-terminal domain-containing protein n=1 Tax=Paenibacillus apiarius TaxID=46240 RepID=A0ABT4E3Q1_9BACL|nr:hypothetical protein [Paenibacillus apiarius]MBN3524427.1 hypothetical protein [Paenibacillus apiarius]MCY9516607.1 hypothetical protein [Paenibacillus apiarius]MCY9522856.1 hypothetical protein [Paenibacillus apiarius]MCY9550560.1 hypothetical protein [Paenibacillus apiarius]MCY9560795.1 hypothetical protein [Paenibacillus apiarius]
MLWVELMSWVSTPAGKFVFFMLILHGACAIWTSIDSYRIDRSILFSAGITLIVSIAPLFGLIIYIMIRHTKLTSHVPKTPRMRSAISR